MTKIEKLIKFICSQPTEANFDDIRLLLETFGFEELRSKGSHHTFRHPDGRKQTVPKTGG